MAIRCLWPPDRSYPRSPTTLSYVPGSMSMNSSAWAALAAVTTSSKDASGRA